jgi:L-ascorbate metabolism protein UlaG (beta-lactamase superfamily)
VQKAPLSITWLGHATALVELDGARVLTDPALGKRLGPLVRIATRPKRDAIQGIDAVLLSHLHADHADARSLREIPSTVPILAPLGAGGWLARRGFADVREMRPGEEVRIGAARVTATPALHGGQRWPLGRTAEPIGFVIDGSRTVYFAGDTDLFSGMAHLAASVHVALLPVSGWGPTLGPGHLDPARAATAAGLILPTVAVPIHWGTFALPRPLRSGGDPARPAREFAALIAAHLPEVAVRVLGPGERAEIP